MDEYDRLTGDLLAAKDRIISQQRHDLETLVEALSKHEGRDPDATSFRHLGRTL